MGVKRRKSKRKEAITDAERAWLVGDRENAGFTSFAKPGHDDYQARLWREHGDHVRLRGSLIGQDRSADRHQPPGLPSRTLFQKPRMEP
jgi:hypothetical protein